MTAIEPSQHDPSEKPDARYWFTEKQVAKFLGISVSTLRAHRQARKGIPYAKFGRLVRYSLADVAEFLKQRRIDFKTNIANPYRYKEYGNVR